MILRNITSLVICLLVILNMFTGCNTDENTASKLLDNLNKSLAEFLENNLNVYYMDEFISTAQSVIIENDKSFWQSELFYTKTGVNSNSFSYGDLENTVEYTKQNKNGIIINFYSMYITSNVSELILPQNIKYNNSFEDTLEMLGITDSVKNRKDERYFSMKNKDETSEIGISFLSFHAEPVDTNFKTVYATIYFRENIEREDENGISHIYSKNIQLVFSKGKLENINFFLYDEYHLHYESKINNEKVGIKFFNTDYVGSTYKIKLEEIYYKDGKINIVYDIKTNSKTKINILYEGWQSADNGILDEKTTHTINGKKRLIDTIYEPFGNSDYKPPWYSNLYENYLFFRIMSSYLNFNVEFINGNIFIYRNTSI